MRPKLTHPTLALLGSAKPYEELTDPDTTRDMQPPPMLVEDFLTKGSVTGLTAMPGVGKSWLAFEIMRAVATGGKVMGEFQAEQAGVLFVGSDASLHDYAYQWRRLTHDEFHAAQTGDLSDPGYDHVNPYAGCRWLHQSSFTLENPIEICRIIRTHEKFWAGEVVQKITGYGLGDEPTLDMLPEIEGFGLIVFDTFSRLFRGNQNDAAEVEIAMGHMKLIAEATGAAVLVLHHNAKPTEFNDGTDARGSSALVGSLDAWLNLTAKKGDKHYLRGTWKKFRGITPPDFDYRQEVMDPVRAKLMFLDAADSGPGADSLTQSMLELLARTEQAMTVTEIRKALWPVFSDHWKDEKAFGKAISNRTHGGLRPATVEKVPTKMGEPFRFALKKEEQS